MYVKYKNKNYCKSRFHSLSSVGVSVHESGYDCIGGLPSSSIRTVMVSRPSASRSGESRVTRGSNCLPVGNRSLSSPLPVWNNKLGSCYFMGSCQELFIHRSNENAVGYCTGWGLCIQGKTFSTNWCLRSFFMTGWMHECVTKYHRSLVKGSIKAAHFWQLKHSFAHILFQRSYVIIEYILLGFWQRVGCCFKPLF